MIPINGEYGYIMGRVGSIAKHRVSDPVELPPGPSVKIGIPAPTCYIDKLICSGVACGCCAKTIVRPPGPPSLNTPPMRGSRSATPGSLSKFGVVV